MNECAASAPSKIYIHDNRTSISHFRTDINMNILNHSVFCMRNLFSRSDCVCVCVCVVCSLFTRRINYYNYLSNSTNVSCFMCNTLPTHANDESAHFQCFIWFLLFCWILCSFGPNGVTEKKATNSIYCFVYFLLEIVSNWERERQKNRNNNCVYVIEFKRNENQHLIRARCQPIGSVCVVVVWHSIACTQRRPKSIQQVNAYRTKSYQSDVYGITINLAWNQWFGTDTHRIVSPSAECEIDAAFRERKYILISITVEL